MARAFSSSDSNEDSATRLCTVRVNSVDPLCGHLDEKVEVGVGLSKSIVTGSHGLALQLDIDNDLILSGIDSDEMNFIVTLGEDVSTGGVANGRWIMTNHYGSDPLTNYTATLHTISYAPQQEDEFNVIYHNDSTKMLDNNIDDTEDITISYGFSLYNNETGLEATIAIDMVYINTSDAPTFLNIEPEYIIYSDSTPLVKTHDFTFARPADLKPHTALGFYVTIFDGPTAPTTPAVRATSIKMSSGTIYQRVNHYPLEETDIT